MRKVDDGEKKKEKEKNDVFSGHNIIASNRLPESRPLERRMLVPIIITIILFSTVIRNISIRYYLSPPISLLL